MDADLLVSDGLYQQLPGADDNTQGTASPLGKGSSKPRARKGKTKQESGAGEGSAESKRRCVSTACIGMTCAGILSYIQLVCVRV
jgi:hypothetical protein